MEIIYFYLHHSILYCVIIINIFYFLLCLSQLNGGCAPKPSPLHGYDTRFPSFLGILPSSKAFMRSMLILSILLIPFVAFAAATDHCQWNTASGCKTCNSNYYLHDGACVKTCPSGYIGRVGSKFDY